MTEPTEELITSSRRADERPDFWSYIADDLEEARTQLVGAILSCEENPSPRTAAEVCEGSRAMYSAAIDARFFNRTLDVDQIIEVLDRGLAAVQETAREIGTTDRKAQAAVASYAANVEQRIQLLQILKARGLNAVEVEMNALARI